MASPDPSLSAACNALFCILPEHEGDQHTDVTGHSWTEPTPAEPVIARSYDWVSQ